MQLQRQKRTSSCLLFPPDCLWDLSPRSSDGFFGALRIKELCGVSSVELEIPKVLVWAGFACLNPPQWRLVWTMAPWVQSPKEAARCSGQLWVSMSLFSDSHADFPRPLSSRALSYLRDLFLVDGGLQHDGNTGFSVFRGQVLWLCGHKE